MEIDFETDFIGGQGALTIEEEEALREYFKKKKIEKEKKLKKATSISKSKKNLTD
jgi:hypothetical protein